MTTALFGTSQLTMPAKTSGGKLAGGERILSPQQQSRPITPMQQSAAAASSLAPLAPSDSSTPPPLPAPLLPRPRSGLAYYHSSPSPSGSVVLAALPSLPASANSSRRGSSNDQSLSSSLASSLANSHAGTPSAHSPAVNPGHASYSAHFAGAATAAPSDSSAASSAAFLMAPTASAAAAMRPGLGLPGASAQLLSLQPPLDLLQQHTQTCLSPHSHSPLYRGSNTPSPSSTARRMQLQLSAPPAPPPVRAGLPVAPGALVVSAASKHPPHVRARSHSGDDASTAGSPHSMQSPQHQSSPQQPLRGSKAVAGTLSGGRPAGRSEAVYL